MDTAREVGEVYDAPERVEEVLEASAASLPSSGQGAAPVVPPRHYLPQYRVV